MQKVTGKGNKTRLVPTTDELIADWRATAARTRCRLARSGGKRSLVLPVIGSGDKALSRSALHLILKEVYGFAAERLRGSGPEWEAQAAGLASSSAHWMRHTAGSHMTYQQVETCALCATTSGTPSLSTTRRLSSQRGGCTPRSHAGAASSYVKLWWPPLLEARGSCLGTSLAINCILTQRENNLEAHA
ncbi:hypothetical protein [Cupriavidus sp. DF5525]|uniref:hypothetical protein n=1 Tax=Cupriavidus sp. DF5525 TaxID=3160989 RepID=UPI0032DFA623